MQKVLIMTTSGNGMRDEVIGWGGENGDCVSDCFYKCQRGEHKLTKKKYVRANDIPVGLMGGVIWQHPSYSTVLHALGDGWKLLAPPTEDEAGGYEWWLVRE